jgi:hypothetical protein
MLPYLSWLDYCSIAYVVQEQRAREDATAVVQRLQAVSDKEADTKLRALRELRDAFVFRENSSAARPSAAEYILDEACRRAKAFSAAGVKASTVRVPKFRQKRLPEVDLSRCML